jgi:uncharacterized protein YjbI with pentapeptide repeats
MLASSNESIILSSGTISISQEVSIITSNMQNSTYSLPIPQSGVLGSNIGIVKRIVAMSDPSVCIIVKSVFHNAPSNLQQTFDTMIMVGVCASTFLFNGNSWILTSVTGDVNFLYSQAPISNFSLTSYNSAITSVWNPPFNSQFLIPTGSPITYTLQVYDDQGNLVRTITTTDHYFIIGDLLNGIMYTVNLFYNTIFTTSNVSTLTAQCEISYPVLMSYDGVTAASISSSISGINHTSYNSSIFLNWSQPIGSDNSFPTLSYKICYSPDNIYYNQFVSPISSNPNPITDPTRVSFMAYDLTNDTPYFFAIYYSYIPSYGSYPINSKTVFFNGENSITPLITNDVALYDSGTLYLLQSNLSANAEPFYTSIAASLGIVYDSASYTGSEFNIKYQLFLTDTSTNTTIQEKTPNSTTLFTSLTNGDTYDLSVNYIATSNNNTDVVIGSNTIAINRIRPTNNLNYAVYVGTQVAILSPSVLNFSATPYNSDVYLRWTTPQISNIPGISISYTITESTVGSTYGPFVDTAFLLISDLSNDIITYNYSITYVARYQGSVLSDIISIPVSVSASPSIYYDIIYMDNTNTFQDISSSVQSFLATPYNSAVYLTWRPPQTTNSQGISIDYTITDGTTTYGPFTDTTSYLISGLSNDTTYNYSISYQARYYGSLIKGFSLSKTYTATPSINYDIVYQDYNTLQHISSSVQNLTVTPYNSSIFVKWSDISGVKAWNNNVSYYYQLNDGSFNRISLSNLTSIQNGRNLHISGLTNDINYSVSMYFTLSDISYTQSATTIGSYLQGNNSSLYSGVSTITPSASLPICHIRDNNLYELDPKVSSVAVDSNFSRAAVLTWGIPNYYYNGQENSNADTLTSQIYWWNPSSNVYCITYQFWIYDSANSMMYDASASGTQPYYSSDPISRTPYTNIYSISDVSAHFIGLANNSLTTNYTLYVQYKFTDLPNSTTSITSNFYNITFSMRNSTRQLINTGASYTSDVSIFGPGSISQSNTSSRLVMNKPNYYTGGTILTGGIIVVKSLHNSLGTGLITITDEVLTPPARYIPDNNSGGSQLSKKNTKITSIYPLQYPTGQDTNSLTEPIPIITNDISFTGFCYLVRLSMKSKITNYGNGINPSSGITDTIYYGMFTRFDKMDYSNYTGIVIIGEQDAIFLQGQYIFPSKYSILDGAAFGDASTNVPVFCTGTTWQEQTDTFFNMVNLHFDISMTNPRILDNKTIYWNNSMISGNVNTNIIKPVYEYINTLFEPSTSDVISWLSGNGINDPSLNEFILYTQQDPSNTNWAIPFNFNNGYSPSPRPNGESLYVRSPPIYTPYDLFDYWLYTISTVSRPAAPDGTILYYDISNNNANSSFVSKTHIQNSNYTLLIATKPFSTFLHLPSICYRIGNQASIFNWNKVYALTQTYPTTTYETIELTNIYMFLNSYFYHDSTDIPTNLKISNNSDIFNNYILTGNTNSQSIADSLATQYKRFSLFCDDPFGNGDIFLLGINTNIVGAIYLNEYKITKINSIRFVGVQPISIDLVGGENIGAFGEISSKFLIDINGLRSVFGSPSYYKGIFGSIFNDIHNNHNIIICKNVKLSGDNIGYNNQIHVYNDPIQGYLKNTITIYSNGILQCAHPNALGSNNIINLSNNASGVLQILKYDSSNNNTFSIGINKADSSANIVSDASHNPLYIYYPSLNSDSAGIQDRCIKYTGPGSSSETYILLATEFGTMQIIYDNATTMRNNNYTAMQSHSAGFTARQLQSGGYSINELSAAEYSKSEILSAGYTATQLKDALYTASDLFGAEYPPSDLKTAGYTAIELRNAGYSDDDILNLGYTVSQLKAAGYTATLLKTLGYSATQLKNVGYTVIELKTAEYSDHDILTAGYTVAELKDASYTAIELKTVGYSDSSILTAGYTAIQLKDAGYSAIQLHSIGYTATELKDVGYTATQLKDVGYTATQLKDVGYTASELKPAGYAASDLFLAGFVISDLQEAGYIKFNILRAGYTARQLNTAGYTASDLQETGLFSVSDLKVAGYLDSDILGAGYDANDLKIGGYNATQLKAAEYNSTQLKAAGYNAYELFIASFSISDLQEAEYFDYDILGAGYDAADLKYAGYVVVSDLKAAGYTATQLRLAGYSDSDILTAGYTATQLKNALYTATDLFGVGYTSSELKTAGYTVSDLQGAGYLNSAILAAGYSASDLKGSGYSASDLKGAGYTASDLQGAGYTASDLQGAGYTISDLQGAGYTNSDILGAGYTASDLQGAGYIPSLLQGAGYSNSDILGAGYSASDLQGAGYTISDLQGAGYSNSDILGAGYIPSDLQGAGYTISDLQGAGYTDYYIINAGYNAFDFYNGGTSYYTPQELWDAGYVSTADNLTAAGYDPTDVANAGYV